MAQEKTKYSIKHFLKNAEVFVLDGAVWENNVFRVVVKDAGLTNKIDCYGKINGQSNYVLIDSIIGNGTKDFDISLYDFIKLECSVFDSPINYIDVTGSAFSVLVSTLIGGGDASSANQVITNNLLQDIQNKIDLTNTKLDESKIELQDIQALQNSQLVELQNVTNNQQAANALLQNLNLEATQEQVLETLQDSKLTLNSIDSKVTKNIRDLILNSPDVTVQLTYADLGTKNRRIIKQTFTSPTYPTITLVRNINYILDGNFYIKSSLNWDLE